MNKKLELKKHVGTIQCSNALSLVQRKISNALLYHAYPDLLNQEEHTIEIKKLCGLIGYDSHDYSLIKKGLKKLLSTVIEWNILQETTKKEDVWSASSILASVSLQGALCFYSYSPRMKQLLYTPAMYGRIDLVTQSKFKSNYALALYENCVRYQSLPYTGWFNIELFRKLMGVSPDQYKIYRDFKRRIIDKAVEEVNKYSNLCITPEMKKLQRKVVSIRFKIDVKRAAELSSDSNVVQQLVKGWNLTIYQAEQLINDYGYVAVRAKLLELEKSRKTDVKINNKFAYLNACFQDVKKERRNVTITKPLLMYNKKEVTHDLFVAIDEKLKKTEMRQKIEDNFISYLQKEHKNFLWKYFVNKKWEHPAIQSEFITYVKKNHSDIVATLVDENIKKAV